MRLEKSQARQGKRPESLLELPTAFGTELMPLSGRAARLVLVVKVARKISVTDIYVHGYSPLKWLHFDYTNMAKK